MAILPVVKYGNPILRKRMKSVDSISHVSSLIKDMFDTMYQEDGIGLAANQVGVDFNLSVVDISHTEECDTPFVFINGKIIDKWGESVIEEGCLSLPGIRVDVPRSEGIRFSYLDPSGTEHVEDFEGLLARVIQHEIDHLNGLIIIDRVSPLIKQQFKSQLKEIASISDLEMSSKDSP